eukprot:COSAG04_NODE_15228_length_539_cov_0.709091_2_plen_34_part_01
MKEPSWSGEKGLAAVERGGSALVLRVGAAARCAW